MKDSLNMCAYGRELANIIIIKRISRAAIYCTRWE